MARWSPIWWLSACCWYWPIITFAVNKKTVKNVGSRKLIHSESWIVALVGIVVAISMMLSGPLATLLNNATLTKYAV